MLTKTVSPLLALTLAASLPVCGATPSQTIVGAPPSVILPGEVVVKTPEDIVRGKENVAGVANQLRALFAPARKRTRAKTDGDELYLKVFKAGKGKANLIYRFRYATSKKVFSTIETMLSNEGSLEYAEEQNLLVINDLQENINALAAALPAVDAPSPQVLIEAKVIEVLLSDGMQRNLSVMFNDNSTVKSYDKNGAEVKQGITNSAGMNTSSLAPSASSDGGQFDWTFAMGDKNIQTSFQWLLNAQDARVLSAPTIVVARNEESVISNGQDVPIQSQTNTNGSIQTSTTFKRVGVTLTVTPKMVNSDSVTLRVEPQVSNIQSYQTISQGSSSYQVPVISIRNIKTDVKLADGQVIVMGGLYNVRESVQQERIPFVSDMPYIGEFFTSKYQEKELIQLLFFLRVRILTADDLADGILFDPDEIVRTTNESGDIIRNSPTLPKLENTITKVKREFIKRDQSAEPADATSATPESLKDDAPQTTEGAR